MFWDFSLLFYARFLLLFSVTTTAIISFSGDNFFIDDNPPPRWLYWTFTDDIHSSSNIVMIAGFAVNYCLQTYKGTKIYRSMNFRQQQPTDTDEDNNGYLDNVILTYYMDTKCSRIDYSITIPKSELLYSLTDISLNLEGSLNPQISFSADATLPIPNNMEFATNYTFNSLGVCTSKDISQPRSFVSFAQNVCLGVMFPGIQQTEFYKFTTSPLYRIRRYGSNTCKSYGYFSSQIIVPNHCQLPSDINRREFEEGVRRLKFREKEEPFNFPAVDLDAVIDHIYNTYANTTSSHRVARALAEAQSPVFDDLWVPANDDLSGGGYYKDPQQPYIRWEKSFVAAPTAAPVRPPGSTETFPPTRKPTLPPTLAPTKPLVYYQLLVTQSMNNVPVTAMESDVMARAVFAQATSVLVDLPFTAIEILNISTTYISITALESTSTEFSYLGENPFLKPRENPESVEPPDDFMVSLLKRLELDLPALPPEDTQRMAGRVVAAADRALATSQIFVSYAIKFSPVQLNVTTPEAATQYIKSKLTKRVLSGVQQLALVHFATNKNVTTLFAVSVNTAPVVSDFSLIPDTDDTPTNPLAPSDTADSVYSIQFICFVAVGAFVFFVVLYFSCQMWNTGSVQITPLTGESLELHTLSNHDENHGLKSLMGPITPELVRTRDDWKLAIETELKKKSDAIFEAFKREQEHLNRMQRFADEDKIDGWKARLADTSLALTQFERDHLRMQIDEEEERLWNDMLETLTPKQRIQEGRIYSYQRRRARRIEQIPEEVRAELTIERPDLFPPPYISYDPPTFMPVWVRDPITPAAENMLEIRSMLRMSEEEKNEWWPKKKPVERTAAVAPAPVAPQAGAEQPVEQPVANITAEEEKDAEDSVSEIELLPEDTAEDVAPAGSKRSVKFADESKQRKVGKKHKLQPVHKPSEAVIAAQAAVAAQTAVQTAVQTAIQTTADTALKKSMARALLVAGRRRLRGLLYTVVPTKYPEIPEGTEVDQAQFRRRDPDSKVGDVESGMKIDFKHYLKNTVLLDILDRRIKTDSERYEHTDHEQLGDEWKQPKIRKINPHFNPNYRPNRREKDETPVATPLFQTAEQKAAAGKEVKPPRPNAVEREAKKLRATKYTRFSFEWYTQEHIECDDESAMSSKNSSKFNAMTDISDEKYCEADDLSFNTHESEVEEKVDDVSEIVSEIVEEKQSEGELVVEPSATLQTVTSRLFSFTSGHNSSSKYRVLDSKSRSNSGSNNSK